MQLPRMMFVFCGNCYSRSYLALPLNLFIPYVILKKLRCQYFLSIACYKETKFIIDYVSVIPIDDLTNFFVVISVSYGDTKLYGTS